MKPFFLTVLFATVLSVAGGEEKKPLTQVTDTFNGFYQKGPWKNKITGTSVMDSPGTEITTTLSGEQIVLDQDHRFIAFTITAKLGKTAAELPPGMPESMEIHVKIVADGEWLWAETDMPQFERKQISKMSWETAKEFMAVTGCYPQSLGFGLMSPIGFCDAVKDLEGKTVSSESDQVKVTVPLEKIAPGLSGEMAAAYDLNGFYPLDMRMEAMGMKMTQNESERQVVAEKDLDKTLFTYTPTEGIPVQDLTDVTKSMMAQLKSPTPAGGHHGHDHDH